MSKLDKTLSTHNLNSLLSSLQTIGSIKEYDKISINNDTIILDEPTMFQGIRRYLYGDSREETITRFNNIITNMFKYIDNMLINPNNRNISYEINDSLNISHVKNTNTDSLNKIVTNMQSAIKGIQNLKITYIGDETINSKLDLIITKLDNRLNKINKFILK